MKKLIYCFLLLIPQVVLADDQEFTGGVGLSEPFSMQVPMFALNNDAGNYASGGWRFSEEYRNGYASCQGRYVMAETIMRRPGD